jgi:large subunit ribosomal protein L4e
MSNADLARLINSDEIQSVVRPAAAGPAVVLPKKRNAVKNAAVRIALNPYHKTVRDREMAKAARTPADKKKALAASNAALKKRGKEFAARRRAFYAAAVKEGEISF